MVVAIMLVLLAGGMNGSFAVPMKYLRGWEWEHAWLVWSFLGMLVLPLSIAVLTIPSLRAVYCATGLEPLAVTVLYGMVWGLGTVLFGLGLTRVGLALGFGIVLGTSSSLGTILPLAIFHGDKLFMNTGLLTFAGVGVILAGVAASARAGLLREPASSQCQRSIASGRWICVLAGIGSSCMSLGLNASGAISTTAETFGASHASSMNAAWPVLLGGGLIVNAAYCSFLIVRRHNVKHFGEAASTNLSLVLAMAVLWSGSNFVYSAGAREMGPFGLVLAWPIFMAVIMLTANIWGLVMGEWRSAGRRASTWAAEACLLLVAGIWIIALAGNTP